MEEFCKERLKKKKEKTERIAPSIFRNRYKLGEKLRNSFFFIGL